MQGHLDIYLLDSGPLLVGRPTGVLDGELATKLVEFVEIKEALMETGFHRFCDMTQLDGINLALNQIEVLALRRRVFNPNMIRVKSAFLATNPLTQGIVAIYRSRLQSRRIEVQGFETVELAAKWLEVSCGKLKF